MREYRTLDDVTVEYFVQHPEEIEPFLNESFADYALDGDSAALLAALRVIARVKGISSMAEEIGLTRQGLQKALSAKGTPPAGQYQRHHARNGLSTAAPPDREKRRLTMIARLSNIDDCFAADCPALSNCLMA